MEKIGQLKQQLAAGTITEEQYATSLASLLAAGDITQEEHDGAKSESGNKNPGGDQPAFSEEQLAAIQKMMQSEADKVRTKAATEKKALEAELEKLRTDKMSEEEKAKHDLEQLRKTNEQTAKELMQEKVAFHTVKTLSAKKLPAQFDEFLMGSTVEETDKRIGAFETAWQAAIKAEIENQFKQNGDDPNRRQGGGTVKTWNEMTLTEQGQLFTKDPERARSLAKAAGVTL